MDDLIAQDQGLRPSILEARAKGVKSVLKDTSSEIAGQIHGTRSILVVIDSVNTSSILEGT